jgi:hypothetical protein
MLAETWASKAEATCKEVREWAFVRGEYGDRPVCDQV